MAKRLNKRQQRELEELRELESAKVELQSGAQAEISESDEEQVAEPVKKKFNPFDAVSYHLTLLSSGLRRLAYCHCLTAYGRRGGYCRA
jgi:hypothetical protein